jgi:hypothetical protein
MKLNDVINEIALLADTDKVNIKGKFYTTVDKRLQLFRREFGLNANIQTNILHNDLERVLVQAIIIVFVDGDWREVARGYAEEFRGKNLVNQTSAIENCETSAIGRALANLGLGGGEYASAFEVQNAINNKPKAPDLKDMYVLRNEKDTVLTVADNEKSFLNDLRTFLSEPESQECKNLYDINKEVISLALKNSKGDLKKSFQTVTDLFSGS